jgi:hypothetical protein
MKTPAWFPTASAWACSVALLLFSRGLLIAAALVVPLLMEIARVSPRIAALGGLGLWLSPIALVATGHRVVSAVVDARDRTAKRPAEPRLVHAWAGLFGWLVIFLATSTTLFLGAVIDPKPTEPDGMLGMAVSAVGAGTAFSVRTVLWVVVAAILYRFEQRARAALSAAA